MFNISGPPLIFQFYRQPLTLVQIRHALIVLFTTTSATRVLFGVCEYIRLLSALATPVVMLTTVAGRHYPPPLSLVALRRVTFGVSVAIGVGLIATLSPPLLHRA